MKMIRSDSRVARAYNEGLVVFLYDEANAETIRAKNPSILGGYGDSDINDELFELTENGLLALYELQQDDELAVEVAFGAPLSADEIAASGWSFLPVLRARLSLPSGKLAIEGYNNLRLSDDFDPDEEPGAVLDVPAGDYVLTLYQLDVLADENDNEDEEDEAFEGDENDEDEDGDEPSMPGQIVVLTPSSAAEPLEQSRPMIIEL